MISGPRDEAVTRALNGKIRLYLEDAPPGAVTPRFPERG